MIGEAVGQTHIQKEREEGDVSFTSTLPCKLHIKSVQNWVLLYLVEDLPPTYATYQTCKELGVAIL